MVQDRLVAVVVLLLALQVTSPCGPGGTCARGAEPTDPSDVGFRGATANDPSKKEPANERAFSHFAFSPDGQYVLAGGRWDVGSAAVLWTAEDGSTVRHDAVVFSPAGSVMAVARRGALRAQQRRIVDYEIVIEKVADGNKICTLPLRPNMSPPAISFSDDGRYVIGSGSWLLGEPAVRKEPPLDIWDAQTGDRVWDPDRRVPYALSEFEQRREALLREVGNGRLSRISAEADLKLLLLLRNVRKDGKPLVVRGTIHTHGLSHFSPDGRWLVTRDGIMPYTEYSSEAVIWDARDCRLVREFDEDDTWVEPFLFDVDGSRFLRRAHERPRQIYETATGKPIRVFGELPNAGVLAWATDGKAAVLGESGQAVLFDTESGRLIKSFAVQGSVPRQARFSPDGSRLAIDFCDHSVDRLRAEFRDCAIVYEVRDSCREVFRLQPPPRAQRYRWYPVSYNADGRRILYGGALWDGNTGRKIRQFRIVYD